MKKQDPIKNIAIISTCYFPSNLFDFDVKTFKYITSLIQFIETFQYKINLLNKLCKKNNTTKWFLRIYIDSLVFKLNRLIDDPSLLIKLKFPAEIIENIQTYQKIYSFIGNFFIKYIDQIISSENINYENIEIYSYDYNPKNIIDKSDTFGTLFRFHPLIDNRITHCIMRNCSFPITMLDLFIQKYWIENTEFEYCSFGARTYVFKEKNNLSRLKKIYELNKNEMPFTNNNIKRGTARSMAGLFSCKILPENLLYIAKYFMKFKKTYIDTKFNNNNTVSDRTKFAYGIDEIIMKKIFKNYSSDGDNTIHMPIIKDGTEFIDETSLRDYKQFVKKKLQLKNTNTLPDLTIKPLFARLGFNHVKYDKLGREYLHILTYPTEKYKFTPENIYNCNLLSELFFRKTYREYPENSHYKLQGTLPFVREGEDHLFWEVDDYMSMEIITQNLELKTNFITKILFNKIPLVENQANMSNNEDSMSNNDEIYDTYIEYPCNGDDLNIMDENAMWQKEPLFKIININLTIDSISILHCVEQFIDDINKIFLEINFYPLIKIPLQCKQIIQILIDLGIK